MRIGSNEIISGLPVTLEKLKKSLLIQWFLFGEASDAIVCIPMI